MHLSPAPRFGAPSVLASIHVHTGLPEVVSLYSAAIFRPQRSQYGPHGPGPLAASRTNPVAAIAGRVGVSHVQPDGSVFSKHTLQLTEGLDDIGHVVRQSIVSADLFINVLVSEGPVGRGSHHGLN